MPTNYADNSVWGADYRRAIANGDTAYAQKLQAAMDAMPQAQTQSGQIMANTVAMGRDAPVWANGAQGQQVNQLGQTRTAQAAQGWDVAPSQNGGLYQMRQPNPQQPQFGGGLLGSVNSIGQQRITSMPSNSFGQASAYQVKPTTYGGYQNPFGWGGGGQYSGSVQYGNASPYRRGGLL